MNHNSFFILDWLTAVNVFWFPSFGHFTRGDLTKVRIATTSVACLYSVHIFINSLILLSQTILTFRSISGLSSQTPKARPSLSMLP